MRLSKTETGQAAFKERSPLLSARQRAAFIQVDGKKSLEDLLALGVVQADLDYLQDMGFLAQPSMAGAAAAPAAPRTEQQRYFDAKPIATQLSAGLGLRGFMLNLSVESASGYADLLKLLPKLQAALGVEACRTLERALLE